MPYTPTTWVNNTTPLDATNMNHLETGLQAAAASAEQAPRADAITSITAWDVPVWNGSSWVRPSGTASVAKFLRGDGSWALPVSAATALPSSPVDGQLAVLTDSLTSPTYAWTFRYNSGGSTYKWEFVGGSPASHEVATSEGTASTAAFTDLATVGPTLTVPRAGVYDIRANCQLHGNGVATTIPKVGVKLGSAAVATPETLYGAHDGYDDSAFLQARRTLAASDVVKMQYKVSANTGAFYNRSLTITPVRVS